MPNSIELLERFNDLPEDVKKVIGQFEYDDALKTVHAKHKLHIDQAAALEKELARVIFGDAKSHDLIPNIEKELRLSPEKAKTVAFDVNKTILMPLQQAMKKLQTEDDTA